MVRLLQKQWHSYGQSPLFTSHHQFNPRQKRNWDPRSSQRLRKKPSSIYFTNIQHLASNSLQDQPSETPRSCHQPTNIFCFKYFQLGHHQGHTSRYRNIRKKINRILNTIKPINEGTINNYFVSMLTKKILPAAYRSVVSKLLSIYSKLVKSNNLKANLT